MKSISYIKDRLQEPGSIRSLALVIWMAKGALPTSWTESFASPEDVEKFIYALLFLMGVYSFLKPETKNTVIAPDVVVVETPKVQG